MFRLFLLGITLTSSIISSGQNPWIGTTPMLLGIGQQNYTISPVYNNFRYEQVRVENPIGSLDESSKNTVSYSRIPLAFENIGSRFYGAYRATGAVGLLQDRGGYKYVGDDDTEARRLELIDLLFDYGKWYKEKFGVFGGVQYAYSRMVLKDDDVPDELILGGHQRGVNATFFVNLDKLLFRATVVQDWVRNSKKLSKGSAQSLDLVAYYALTQKRSLGAWGGIRVKQITSTGPTGKPTEDWSNHGIQNQGSTNYSYNLPDISANMMYFRAGLYLMIYQNRK